MTRQSSFFYYTMGPNVGRAQAAVDASEGKDASILDTHARALFDTGKTAEAIKQQKRAVELCDDKDKKRELEATLKEYQRKAGAK